MNIPVIFLLLKKMFVVFPHCVLILGFLQMAFIKLRKLPCVLFFNHKVKLNFIKCFRESNEMIIRIFPFNLSMSYMTYIF